MTPESTLWEEQLYAARILIIDDQSANIQILKSILRHGNYTNLTTTDDPRQALTLYHEVQPDLVLLDLKMPHLDGFAVLQQIRQAGGAKSYLPIVILTSDITPTAKRKALAMGAQDFIAKPLDSIEVLLRIRNILQVYFLNSHMRDQNKNLAQQVREQTQHLEHARTEILVRLARVAEYRDDQTGQHTHRVGQLAGQLAQTLGLPSADVELIHQAAPLHDLGKIGMPDEILLKPSSLTEEEFTIIKRHTVIGGRMLEGSTVPVLQLGETIALTHHEQWDGTGYPQQLKGPAIPLAGRIVAVADVFDVITHERPYKAAESVEHALREIKRCSGSHFDPEVVAALLKIRKPGR